MAHWTYTIRLGDVFHNETMTFPQRRDAICDRLTASQWLRDRGTDSAIADLVDELRDTIDVEEFDDVWNEIYDHANHDRAWIDTVSPVS